MADMIAEKENKFAVEIVSAESEIFSGEATKLFVTGVQGEMEILYNHAPLLTGLAPGPVWITKPDNQEEALVILGGLLEVQREVTIILADSAIRAADCDEQAAKEAIKNIESRISSRDEGLDYGKAHAELSVAIAQLRVIRQLRKGLK